MDFVGKEMHFRRKEMDFVGKKIDFKGLQSINGACESISKAHPSRTGDPQFLEAKNAPLARK